MTLRFENPLVYETNFNEFNNFTAFLFDISKVGNICIIKPPEDWKPTFVIDCMTRLFKINNESDELCSILEYGYMADDFKRNYFQKPVDTVPTNVLENEFWNLVQNKTQFTSSNDKKIKFKKMVNGICSIKTSGFPIHTMKHLHGQDKLFLNTPWNLNNTKENCLLKYTSSSSFFKNVNGCTMQMCFSHNGWRKNEIDAWALDYLHWGDSKTWYCVTSLNSSNYSGNVNNNSKVDDDDDDDDGDASDNDLDNDMAEFINIIKDGECPHINEIVKLKNIKIVKFIQKAEEYVFIPPFAYTFTLSHGFNFSERSLYLPDAWLHHGFKLNNQQLKRIQTNNALLPFSFEEMLMRMLKQQHQLTSTNVEIIFNMLTKIIQGHTKYLEQIIEKGIPLKIILKNIELVDENSRRCYCCGCVLYLGVVRCGVCKKVTCCRHFNLNDSCASCIQQQHQHDQQQSLQHELVTSIFLKHTTEQLDDMIKNLKKNVESHKKWFEMARQLVDKNYIKQYNNVFSYTELHEFKNKYYQFNLEDDSLIRNVEQVIQNVDAFVEKAQLILDSKIPNLELHDLKSIHKELNSLPCKLEEAELIEIHIKTIEDFIANVNALLSTTSTTNSTTSTATTSTTTTSTTSPATSTTTTSPATSATPTTATTSSTLTSSTTTSHLKPRKFSFNRNDINDLINISKNLLIQHSSYTEILNRIYRQVIWIEESEIIIKELSLSSFPPTTSAPPVTSSSSSLLSSSIAMTSSYSISPPSTSSSSSLSSLLSSSLSKQRLDLNDIRLVKNLIRQGTKILRMDRDSPLKNEIERIVSTLKSANKRSEDLNYIISSCLTEHRPELTLEELKLLVKESEDHSTDIKVDKLMKLKNKMMLAEQWEDEFDGLLKNDSSPFLHDMKVHLEKGRGLPISMEIVNQLESDIHKAEEWLNSARDMFVIGEGVIVGDNNRMDCRDDKSFGGCKSGGSLFEILVPGSNIYEASSMMVLYKVMRRRRNIYFPYNIYQIKDPLVLTNSIRDAETKELNDMMMLRAFNKLKRSAKNSLYCFCKKPLSDDMLGCFLCCNCFHASCPKDNKILVPAEATPLLLNTDVTTTSTTSTSTTMSPSAMSSTTTNTTSNNTTNTTTNTTTTNKATSHPKYYCFNCSHSKRPTLESVYQLLVTLHLVPLRIMEGQLLELLVDRVVSWINRLKDYLQSDDCQSIISELVNNYQGLVEGGVGVDQLIEGGQGQRLNQLKTFVLSARPIFEKLERFLVEGELMEVSTDEHDYVWKFMSMYYKSERLVDDFIKSTELAKKLKRKSDEKTKTTLKSTTTTTTLRSTTTTATLRSSTTATTATNNIEYETPAHEGSSNKKTSKLHQATGYASEKLKNIPYVAIPLKRSIGEKNCKNKIKKNKYAFDDDVNNDEKDDDDDDDVVDDDSNDSNDNDREDCSVAKCLRPLGKQVDWIQCDRCSKWYHHICLGLQVNQYHENDEFVCQYCFL